jgi:hypothetical protein
MSDHDHHAQQKDDRVQINRLIRFVRGEHSKEPHSHSSDERPGGAADVDSWNLLDRDDRVSDKKDDQRGHVHHK